MENLRRAIINASMNGSGGGDSSNSSSSGTRQEDEYTSRKRLLEEALRGIRGPAFTGRGVGIGAGPTALPTLDSYHLTPHHAHQAPVGGLGIVELPILSLVSTQHAPGGGQRIFMSAPSSLLQNTEIPVRSVAATLNTLVQHQQERTVAFNGRLRGISMLDRGPVPSTYRDYSQSTVAPRAFRLNSTPDAGTHRRNQESDFDDMIRVQDSVVHPMTKKPRLDYAPPNTNPSPPYLPLGIEEDQNWLSELQCIVRADLVEIVQQEAHVGRRAAKVVSPNQIGIRCRWCVNMTPASRVCRSSAYPSTIRQLYQSYTMMVREHFGNNMCTAIPTEKRAVLQRLRATQNAQGASDSKNYWTYAAMKIGMVDSDHGIVITKEGRAAGALLPPFGSPTTPSAVLSMTSKPAKLLVEPSDMNHTSAFLYVLVSQTQMVYLQESEKVAKRKTLPVGLEGIGCRYCCAVGRYGFSRRFPLRKRSLPEELQDLYCHIKRCPLCPEGTKKTLAILYARHKSSQIMGAGCTVSRDGRAKDPNRDFFDLLWERLGRIYDIKT